MTEEIIKERRKFIVDHSRYPEIILFHPRTGDLFIKTNYNNIDLSEDKEIIKYKEMRVFRSFDVKEGEFKLY
jgi:hypothetical protein